MKLYWVYSVMGNFGSGKTFWTFLEVAQLDREKNFIIANVPYKFVDLFYSLPDELYAIIENLEKWIRATNDDVETYYLSQFDYKNIVLIVDEAHLYFNARKRDKWGLMERLDVILTQCRKRNIKIFFISQRMKRVDINIRRMTDFVIRYKKRSIPILWIQRSTRTVYENQWDLADIQWDDSKTYVMNWESWQFKTDIEKSEIESSQFLPLLKLFWFPIGRRLASGQLDKFRWEAHNSYFISGLPTHWTATKVDETDLQRVEKPLTYRELKIRNWIHKNLPTLVKLLWSKNVKNGYTNWSSVGFNQECSPSPASEWDSEANILSADWMKLWTVSIHSESINPPKRIESFGELRRLEDWVWDRSGTDSDTWNQPRSKIRVRVRQ